jgi:hypothetical protein
MITDTTPPCANCQRLQAEVDALRAELEALRATVAVGVHAIVGNAVRYIKKGRRVGNPDGGGQSAMDVHNRKARAAGGYRIGSLDGNGQPDGETAGRWWEWIVGDNRCTPADQAVFRLDFAPWLASLPKRRRRTAELLSFGHGTGAVARTLGISAAAVSQARAWLEESSPGTPPGPG